MTRAQQLAANAVEADIRAHFADEAARRIHIAGIDELGEWLAVVSYRELRSCREPGRFRFSIWLREAASSEAPDATGVGQTIPDAIESLFRDLAERERVTAEAFRARAKHAA